MTTHHSLAQEFDEAMHALHDRSRVSIKDSLGRPWTGAYFMRGLHNHGGLIYAKRLLKGRGEGLPLPVHQGYPDLTVEALILTPPWHQLFTQGECNIAHSRLIASLVNTGYTASAAELKVQQITGLS